MEIQREDGTLLIEELGNGLRKLTAVNATRDAYRSEGFCTTTYPIELIKMFLDRAGIAAVCEVIGRDGDSITNSIRDLTSAYFNAEDMRGKRILDFGCGGGASTVILAKLFPDSQLIGVELMEDKLQMGMARAAHHGLKNVQFSGVSVQLPASTRSGNVRFRISVRGVRTLVARRKAGNHETGVATFKAQRDCFYRRDAAPLFPH